MPTTNYPQGVTSFGMPILPTVGGLLTTGQVFFVSSAVGKNAPGEGSDPSRPFATLAYALTQTVANRGDLIFVMPGHAESVIAAGTITFSKAGVTVVGLGAGNVRPIFTFSTATAASILFSAASCALVNVVLNGAGIDAVANMIDITNTATDTRIEQCRIYMASATNKAANGIRVAADRVRIVECEFEGAEGAGGVSAIASAAAIAHLRILRCNFQGYYSTALLSSASTNHITQMIVRDCVMRSLTNAGVIFNLTTSSTGLICDCRIQGTGWTTPAGVLANSTGVKFMECYGFDEAAQAVSGVLVPAVGTIA